MTDPLDAVSPLDGRYASRTAPLSPYASERALLRARTRVEVEYLIALADVSALPLSISSADREHLRSIYTEFDRDAAAAIKLIETTGTADRPATNHDVKAVEYYVRDHLPDPALAPWVHFGLTSEDVNNLAYRLLVRGAIESVIGPAVEAVRDSLAEMATQHRSLPMLAHTHGQPATPTTFGKELAVYADRVDRGLDRLAVTTDTLGGKLAGASGTYAAHTVAYTEVNWPDVAARFVDSLGFTHLPRTTQVNPCDDLARVFDALRGINNVCLDLDRDMWLLIGKAYLGQQSVDDETGSSTMPHKVNPIDFENSEGNLSKANADLAFLGEYITTSRLQRDLSDSTVKRTIGGSFAHCLIGYTKTADGLETVVPNETVMRDDLAATPEVLGEAIQTVLRSQGREDAYERVKAATRGRDVTIDDLHELVADLDLPDETAARLADLTPATYTGLAADLVKDR